MARGNARGPLAALVLLGAACCALAGGVLEEHLPHLRCPFASLWVRHGPERAAQLLGLEEHTAGARSRSLLQADTPVWGTCTYVNAFAGVTACVEFRGDTWTNESAAARCESIMPGTAGTLEAGVACPTDETLAGYCVTAEGAEASPSALTESPMMDSCEEAKDSCQTWSQGTFMPAGVCAGELEMENITSSSVGYGAGGAGKAPLCTIAPGPIGAAHQLGTAEGYTHDCEGTPGQGSPYMWPLKWAADVYSKAFAFESEEVTYESHSRVSYSLEKNWKRMDSWYQEGVQFTVGQGPCPEEDQVPGQPNKCIRESKNTTIIHRGSEMYFFEYAPGTKTLVNCTWLDLGLVGNIRPDWFMDKTGAATDVQYIGDSHVYYENEPRLVKQWRKKDFANQYFTMSVQRLPGEDGVHWPLILNIPGEGFGDDWIQYYTNHTTLDDSQDDLFLLDKSFEAEGGTCYKLEGGGGGPPTNQEHIPSNLEIEEASWRSIEYTFSPIWTPEEPAEESPAPGPQEVAPGVFVDACYAEGSVHITASYALESPVWSAISFRENAACQMTPAEAVFAHPEQDGFQVMSGPLLPSLKSVSNVATSDFMDGLTTVPGASVSYGDGEMVLEFTRAFEAKPQQLFMGFAYGTSTTVGYHASRGCFELSSLSTCSEAPPQGSECPVCDECPQDANILDTTGQEESGSDSSAAVAVAPGRWLLVAAAALLVAVCNACLL